MTEPYFSTDNLECLRLDIPDHLNPQATPCCRFTDANSGGYKKFKWNRVYIEAPLKLALKVFEETFHRDPYGVACPCCGLNFYINEYGSLRTATALDRGCRFEELCLPDYKGYLELAHEEWGGYEPYILLSDYLEDETCLFILKEEIAKMNLEG